jgi:hypothetical protein
LWYVFRLSESPERLLLVGTIDELRLVRKGESEEGSVAPGEEARSITVYSDWVRSTLELAWAFEVESRGSDGGLVVSDAPLCPSSIRSEDVMGWRVLSASTTKLRLFEIGELVA